MAYTTAQFFRWLKRIPKGGGFNSFSSSSWDKVCNVLENTLGVGCEIQREITGLAWKIVVTAGNKDGDERWGRVSWEVISPSEVPALYQYKEVFNASLGVFEESETPELITNFASHELAHGVTE